jgi:hypothetical protein
MLKLIFWVVVGVLALSFFGISLEAIITSPIGQANFAFLWQLITDGWNYLVQFFLLFIPGH